MSDDLKLMMRCQNCGKITDPEKWTVAVYDKNTPPVEGAPERSEEDGVCPCCGKISYAINGAISIYTAIKCEHESPLLHH